MNFLQKIYLL